MSTQPRHPDHHRPHSSGEETWQGLPNGFADYLDLEARLSEPARAAALRQAAKTLNAEPSRIVDLGSGTGADAVALAEQFPDAHVHAFDVSAELLQRVGRAASEAGVADRIHPHRVDLDGQWPSEASTGIDLAWASLSLHHTSDPEAVLRRAYAALRPGGVLVLTELTGGQWFDPADLGTGNDRIRARLETALRANGHARSDWPEVLAATGFVTVERRDVDMTAHASTPEGAAYLRYAMRAHRERLSGDLGDAEKAAFDSVITALDDGASTIASHSPRTVWIVSRPDTGAADPGSAIEDADVTILGGGAAGLATAIALGRSRRRIVVVDAGQPRNAPAEGAHNVLGSEGIAPLQLLTRGRAEAESYGVRVLSGSATAVSGSIDDFTVDVDGGSQRVRARRIVLATGLVDDLPDVPGVAEGWGHTVLHCAFCHGWEIRDQRIAILTRDEVAIHHAMLFRQLSDNVTVFLHDAPDPTDEQWEQLRALGVEVVRPRVERLVVDGTQVRAVEIEGGTTFDADAVVVVPRYNARSELYESLGGTAEVTPFGVQIPADTRGATPIPGVWATGNASQPMAMLLASAAAGVTTGTAIHGDLAFADLTRAVEHSRLA